MTIRNPQKYLKDNREKKSAIKRGFIIFDSQFNISSPSCQICEGKVFESRRSEVTLDFWWISKPPEPCLTAIKYSTVLNEYEPQRRNENQNWKIKIGKFKKGKFKSGKFKRVMCWQNWDPARPAKKVLERHKMEKDTKDFTKFKFLVETKIWATVRMMMMIMRSTLILGKTCLTESAPLLRWLGIDQTFHCYSLFSNHSAVTQDTVLLRCFLQIFSMCFRWFVHYSEYCLVRTRSWLQTSSGFLLVVLAISSYFLYKGRQQRKSENLEVEFVLLLHSSTP